MSDIPQAAYHNTLRALDEFDAVATLYDALLHTQRALLRAQNPVAAGKLSIEGDALARQAAAYGQQIRAMRTAVVNANYQGAKIHELNRRFRATEERAQELGTAATRLAELCRTQRNTIAAEIERDRGPVGRTRVRDGYVPARRGLIIDTSW
jgi:hypothetical protein